MSIRLSGVYLVPTNGSETNTEKNSIENNQLRQYQQQQQQQQQQYQQQQYQQQQQQQQHQHHHHNHHHQGTKTVTQRSNSLDYLNFEEKRQIIASSLSLSDFLAHGPAAAAAAAKEVAANTVNLAVNSKYIIFNSKNYCI